MKIGIFGGSFNPPHKGHKNIALTLIQNHYLDKIIFVPTGNFYPKKGLIDAKNRYEMIRLMIKKYHYLEVSDFEFGKLTYTYQTLEYFKNKYPEAEIYFICGSDNIKELTTWRNYEQILDNYKIIVINRGDNLKRIKEYNYMKEKNIITPEIPMINVSSTKIRRDILLGNTNNIYKYIDQEVLNYIINNQLYNCL